MGQSNRTSPPVHLLQQMNTPSPATVYPTGEQQYLELMRKLLDDNHSAWDFNERTGKWARVLISQTFTYDCRAGKLPLITTRQSYAKAALNEMVGYLRGYDSAAQFCDELGVKTWFRNANHTEAWLKSPHRRGQDHIGRAYGVQLRDWRRPDGSTLDQLAELDKKMSKGRDDRGLIMTYYNPGEIELASLRPCLYNLQFSILNGSLYLDATQRSVDVPLGLNFNMCQVSGILYLFAWIYNLKPGLAKHHLVNCHIYEDQIPGVLEQLSRQPFAEPEIVLSSDVKTLDDVLTWFDARKHVKITGYQSHPEIKFPFAD